MAPVVFRNLVQSEQANFIVTCSQMVGTMHGVCFPIVIKVLTVNTFTVQLMNIYIYTNELNNNVFLKGNYVSSISLSLQFNALCLKSSYSSFQ